MLRKSRKKRKEVKKEKRIGLKEIGILIGITKRGEKTLCSD